VTYSWSMRVTIIVDHRLISRPLASTGI
jgi:hypothetical protein